MHDCSRGSCGAISGQLQVLSADILISGQEYRKIDVMCSVTVIYIAAFSLLEMQSFG